MTDQILYQILKELEKTNCLLQAIANSSEQRIPPETKLANYIANEIISKEN